MVRSGRTMASSLSPLLAPMLSSARMRIVCDDATTLQHMLDFEAALARAEAAAGVIPERVVEPVAKACKADGFEVAELDVIKSGFTVFATVSATP